MPQMMRSRERTVRADPAPSRWNYRMQRLMLTPVFRRVLRVGLPFAAALLLGLGYFSDEGRREAAAGAIADVRAEFESRPEFMVKLMAIDGASAELGEEIRQIVPYEFPLSSFDMDLAQVHADVDALLPVKSARVKIRSGGVLQIDVVERQPVALWRKRDGLALVDAEGVEFATVAQRGARPDLPLVVGDGAVDALPEALAIVRAAAPLNDRLRGLARIGARRWDLVLTRDQRIMLPSDAPVRALERMLALDATQDLLARDVAMVDLRLSQRPTLRMTEQATNARRKARGFEVGLKEE